MTTYESSDTDKITSSSQSGGFTYGASLHFLYSVLPTYNSPPAEFRVVHQNGNQDGRGPIHDSVFYVSERLLYEKSQFFATQLKKSRREGQKPQVILYDKVEYVSRNSVACLLQWLYQEKVVLDSGTIEDEIMALIDLARLADQCEIYGLEEDLSAKIKQILLESIQERDTPDGIATILRASHVSAASQLPLGHPVRRVMAAAAVPAFIGREPFYLWNEVTSAPSLALDLLEQLQPILRNCRSSTSYEDPLTGAELDFPDQNLDYSFNPENPEWPEERAD